LREQVHGGFSNEKILANHLQYRSVPWEVIELPRGQPWHYPMMRGGC
jgi:hypothetical protein